MEIPTYSHDEQTRDQLAREHGEEMLETMDSFIDEYGLGVVGPAIVATAQDLAQHSGVTDDVLGLIFLMEGEEQGHRAMASFIRTAADLLIRAGLDEELVRRSLADLDIPIHLPAPVHA